MRFGYDFRVYRENVAPPADVAGRYRFRTDFTRANDLSTSAQPAGQELASFLLGIPASISSIQRAALRSNQNVYQGLYFQDDLRVSSRLTMNLGVRYEYEHPTTERFNRNVRLFDQRSTNPIEAAARAAYASSPIPEITPDAFRVRGGLVFADSNKRRFPHCGPQQYTSATGRGVFDRPKDRPARRLWHVRRAVDHRQL